MSSRSGAVWLLGAVYRGVMGRRVWAGLIHFGFSRQSWLRLFTYHGLSLHPTRLLWLAPTDCFKAIWVNLASPIILAATLSAARLRFTAQP